MFRRAQSWFAAESERPSHKRKPLPNNHVCQEWPEALWGFESGRCLVRHVASLQHWIFWPFFIPESRRSNTRLACRAANLELSACTASKNCGDNTSAPPRRHVQGGVERSQDSKSQPWGVGSPYIVILKRSFSRDFFPGKCRQKRGWTGSSESLNVAKSRERLFSDMMTVIRKMNHMSLKDKANWK